MRKIERHNAGVTMCMDRLCDNPPDYCDEIDYHGLRIFIALCDIHANEAMRTYSHCRTCGMFDPRPDPEDLTDDNYCNETGKLANPGDKACDKYWRRL